jgi:hypothetical protein
MTERLREHPFVAYLTFVLPAALLLLGILFKANILYIMFAAAWLGISVLVLYLPIASDNGSSG